MNNFAILHGNALELLKALPSESIQTCITSPPYYNLRNYQTNPQIWDADESCEHVWGELLETIHRDTRTPEQKAKNTSVGSNIKTSLHMNFEGSCFCLRCGAWKGELGNEPTVQLYIDHLIQIFAEVKRVVKEDGLIFVNLGDTFQGSGKGYNYDPRWSEARTNRLSPIKPDSMPRKSLIGVPSRFEIAMVDELNLCLRNEIHWLKPSAMPTPVKDRFTVDFEKIFMFAKNPKYKFKQQLEPYTKPLNRWGGEELEANGEGNWDAGTGQKTYRDRKMRPNPEGRNMRTTWTINFEPQKKSSHYASYPTELPERCILASTDENDWVLDPFCGTASTGIASLRTNRNFLGLELLPEYVELSNQRLQEFAKSTAETN
jgi:site-specific DNA-methyltransferase (cytosine-N4-specific)